MTPSYVAIDPATGLHLRSATPEERAAFLAARVEVLRLAEVSIVEWRGPGLWFGGAGF